MTCMAAPRRVVAHYERTCNKVQSFTSVNDSVIISQKLHKVNIMYKHIDFAEVVH